MTYRGNPEEYFRAQAPKPASVPAEVLPIEPYYTYSAPDNDFKWLIAGAVILGFFAVVLVIATKK